MKREYQYIIGKLLLRYRKEHQLTQREIAKKLDISYCQISRMEQGKRSITDQNAELILDRLDICLRADEVELDEYEQCFKELLQAIIYISEDKELIFNTLKDKEEKIKETILYFKLPLYDFVYHVGMHNDVSYIDIEKIKDTVDIMPLEDQQLFYDYLGIYHRIHNDFDTAFYYHELSLNIRKDELVYALTSSHIIKVLSRTQKHSKAIYLLSEALRIFEEYGVTERIKICEQMLGLIQLHIRDLSIAESTFIALIIKYSTSDTIVKRSLNNLLWCYAKNSQFKEAAYVTDFLNDNLDLITFSSIGSICIYLCFLNKDMITFDKWYIAYNNLCRSKNELNDKLVDLIYSWFHFDENMITKLYEETLDMIKLPEDKDEYLMINEVLAETYSRLNDYQKASEIYKKLYFIEHGDLNMTSFNE